MKPQFKKKYNRALLFKLLCFGLQNMLCKTASHTVSECKHNLPLCEVNALCYSAAHLCTFHTVLYPSIILQTSQRVLYMICIIVTLVTCSFIHITGRTHTVSSRFTRSWPEPYTHFAYTPSKPQSKQLPLSPPLPPSLSQNRIICHLASNVFIFYLNVNSCPLPSIMTSVLVFECLRGVSNPTRRDIR